MQKLYRHAVAAVVLRPTEVCSPDGCGMVHEILLVHKPRTRDSWQLPQGGVEEGETVEQAARRELQEETSLTDVRVCCISTAAYAYDFPPEFVARHQPVNAGQTLAFVLCTVRKDAKVTVDGHEIDAHAWVVAKQLHLYVQRQAYLDVVLKVVEECRQRITNEEV